MVVAALVLGGFLVATDAFAETPRVQGPPNFVAKPNIPTNAAGSKAGLSRYTSPTGNNTSFGMSGPYVGTKYIGNK